MSLKQTEEEMQNEVDAALDKASMISKDKTEDIPEAPAVSNIKVWIKGYGVMLTVRGEKMMDIIKKTETLIDYAESHGWKNTWNTPEMTNKAVVGQPVTPQDVNKMIDAPLCSIHGTPMKFLEGVSKKTGKPYSFWSCPSKLADGSFCNGKPLEK